MTRVKSSEIAPSATHHQMRELVAELTDEELIDFIVEVVGADADLADELIRTLQDD